MVGFRTGSRASRALPSRSAPAPARAERSGALVRIPSRSSLRRFGGGRAPAGPRPRAGCRIRCRRAGTARSRFGFRLIRGPGFGPRTAGAGRLGGNGAYLFSLASRNTFLWPMPPARRTPRAVRVTAAAESSRRSVSCSISSRSARRQCSSSCHAGGLPPAKDDRPAPEFWPQCWRTDPLSSALFSAGEIHRPLGRFRHSDFAPRAQSESRQ